MPINPKVRPQFVAWATSTLRDELAGGLPFLSALSRQQYLRQAVLSLSIEELRALPDALVSVAYDRAGSTIEQQKLALELRERIERDLLSSFSNRTREHGLPAKRIREIVIPAVSERLAAKPTRLPERGSLGWRSDMDGYIVETEIEIGRGRGWNLRYAQDVLSPDQELLIHLMSVLPAWGLAGETTWALASDDEAVVAASCLASAVGAFCVDRPWLGDSAK